MGRKRVGAVKNSAKDDSVAYSCQRTTPRRLDDEHGHHVPELSLRELVVAANETTAKLGTCETGVGRRRRPLQKDRQQGSRSSHRQRVASSSMPIDARVLSLLLLTLRRPSTPSLSSYSKRTFNVMAPVALTGVEAAKRLAAYTAVDKHVFPEHKVCFHH